MNVHRVLRPALKLVTVSLVTAVGTLGALSGSGTATAGHAPVTTPYSAAKIDKVAVRVSPAFASDTYESRVQYWINVQRKHHGLRALRLASCTDKVAENWSSYLASTDGFYHQSMTKLLNECNAYYAGETLGRGTIKPYTLVNMWMHSTEHRHVLLSSHPTRIGIGATPNSRGEWVTCANFMRF
jgi:uncharacterized protein YkwD